MNRLFSVSRTYKVFVESNNTRYQIKKISQKESLTSNANQNLFLLRSFNNLLLSSNANTSAMSRKNSQLSSIPLQFNRFFNSTKSLLAEDHDDGVMENVVTSLPKTKRQRVSKIIQDPNPPENVEAELMVPSDGSDEQSNPSVYDGNLPSTEEIAKSAQIDLTDGKQPVGVIKTENGFMFANTLGPSIRTVDPKFIKYVPPVTSEWHFTEAVKKHNSGNLDEALEFYSKAIIMDKFYWQVFNNKGNVYLEMAKYEEAIEAYDEAIRLRPSYKVAHYNRGNALSALGRLEEALASYDAAIRADPAYREAHNNKGAILLSLDRYEEAAAAFEEAIKIDNLCKEARFNKGYALFLARKFEEALSSYDGALREYQKSLNSYERFQTFKKMLMEDDTEEEEGQKYLFIDKDDTEDVEVEEKKVPTKSTSLESRLDSDEDTLMESPEEKALREKEEEESRANVAEINGWLSRIHNNKGNTLMALKRYEESLECYDSAVEKNPDNVESYYNKGLALFALQRYEESAASHSLAVEKNPELKEAHLGRGDAYFAMYMFEEAIENYKKALALDPNFVPAKNGKKIAEQELKK